MPPAGSGKLEGGARGAAVPAKGSKTKQLLPSLALKARNLENATAIIRRIIHLAV